MVTTRKPFWNRPGHHSTSDCWPIVIGVVTKRLYLKEHRVAKGIPATEMARRLGIERESVYRLEREPRRANPDKQLQWARALHIELEDLWSPPGRPSLDAMISKQPKEIQDLAVDIVRRLISRT